MIQLPTIAEIPSLLEQWDYDKNIGNSPSDITCGSGKKVWWKCSNGHSYHQYVFSHAKGIGCPYCRGVETLQGFNDLQTANPVYLKEWDEEKNAPLKPDMVRMMSNKKVWWKCSEDHSYNASLDKRAAGCGCPYCAGKKVLVGFNDLQSIRPEVAKLWAYEKNGQLTPAMVAVKSNKRVWWKCNNNHFWKAQISYVTEGTRCPYCAGKKAWPGFNDLKSVNPILAAEWDYEKNKGLQPDSITYGSKKGVWWNCSEGHIWRAQICNRVAGKGCPYCAGHELIAGSNDLLTVFPSLAEEWNYEKNNGVNPQNVFAFSNSKVWWKCKKGHIWMAKISNRANGKNCPYCEGRVQHRTHLIM